MVDRSDPEEARYIALGQRNAEVIDLFQRFCGNIRVEVSGGTGMLEMATGLPIGHRAFRCAHASGNIVSGMMLGDLAVDFYEQHCRTCAFRARSGLLGDTIATVADARRADQQARADRENAEAAERQRQRDERAGRRSRRGAGEQYQSVTQLKYVDKLDAPGGSPEAADVEWLVRTASLAPEVISDAAAAELVELAGDPRVPWGSREAAQAVLVPLTTAGRTPATATAPVALANLAEGPGHQAGRLLVAAAGAVEAASVTGKVARSAAELAGATSDPVARLMSRFTREAVVADPAPLLLCTARNLEAVLQAVELMLATDAPAASPATVLVGPDGQPLRPPAGGVPGIPDEADRSRSIAAAACLPLIGATPAAVPRLVEALARSLELPDHDISAPVSNVISRTLGLALLDQYDTAAPAFLESAHRISADARKELFGAVSSALHADLGPGEPDARPRIVQLAVDRLQGDWGEPAATKAAVTLRDQARFHPERLAGHASALVGALVVEITRPVPPPAVLTAPPDALARIEELGRRQGRQTRISSLQSAVGYLVQAGADDAVTAVFSLLDTEDDGSEDAVVVRAAATRLLGDIGSRPVHLPAVVPRLYTGLLHTEPRIRQAAIRSWEDLAGRPQPLPSTLLDLLPALLTDGSAVLTALRLVRRLDVPLERRAGLLPLVMGAAYAAHGAALSDPESAIEACTGALLSLAHGLPGQEPEAPALVALVVADRLSAYGQQDLLLSWWPPRVANSGLFAQRALSVLAAPEFADPFRDRDYRVQAALLGCPYGTGLQPLDRFLAVTDVHLPDRPWPALEMIEALQRAARWDDAAQVAGHIAASIPQDREHQARLDLAAVIAEIAAGEAALRTGPAPAAPAALGQSGEALDEILARFAAAADARRALQEASRPQPPPRLGELAGRLDSAARVISTAQVAPAMTTETAWAAWAGALRCTAHLLRWDAATQDASGDATRHLQAARRRAQVALADLPTGSGDDPLLQQAAGLTAQIAAVQEPGGIAELARQLALVPLPLRVIKEARGWSYPPPMAGEDSQPVAPAVGICRLDGVLVTNAHVLRPDEVHDLGLEIRLTQWPDQATALEVTFLSVLSPRQARLPSFAFPRVPPDEDGIWRLSGSGSLSVSFTLPAGAPPLAFPVAARFTGPGLDEVLPVAGHSELQLRPFDATTDGLTRRPQLDERLADMYTVLHGKNLNADDVQAFCRLYTAIAAKAVDIQYQRSYMRKHGGGVTERSFHDDLFGRLLADPALEGRVLRGTRAAAGFLDIAHDRINAELKVSKKTPVTVETSHNYLGQAADYAADTGSQLSILVVLDMTPTKKPPGVLENYLGFMEPELAGLRDPRFPSLVGVIVIKGSLLIPSGYSRGASGPAVPVKP
jgi:hypothetical protein